MSNCDPKRFYSDIAETPSITRLTFLAKDS